jgi:hypothetical protein
MSCSLLTSWLYSLSCLFCGDVICGTSYFYSFDCFSYGDIICGTFTICLVAYITISTTCTIVGTIDGSTMPFIIFYARACVLSYYLFTLEPKALLSSTLFFLLRSFFGKFVVSFFYFPTLFTSPS